MPKKSKRRFFGKGNKNKSSKSNRNASTQQEEQQQHESDSEDTGKEEEGVSECGTSLVSRDSALAMGQVASEINSEIGGGGGGVAVVAPKEATITLKVIQFIGELPKETRDDESVEASDNVGDNKSITDSLLHNEVGDVPKLDHNSKEEKPDEADKHRRSFDDNYRVESPKQICTEDSHSKRHAMLIQEISESSSSEEVKQFLDSEATALEKLCDKKNYRVESPESSDESNVNKSAGKTSHVDVTVQEISESSSAESVRNEILASAAAENVSSLKIINIKELPSESSCVTNVSSQPKFECKTEKKLNKAEEAILEALYGNKSLLQKPNLPLDVISEEGSECGSDVVTKQNFSGDELDDDVFLPPAVEVQKKPPSKPRRRHQVVEQPVLISAKIIETEMSIPEGCNSWETSEGDKELEAELVYLTSASSSATDLSEQGDITDNENAAEDDSSEGTETNSLLENVEPDMPIEIKFSQVSAYYHEVNEQKLADIIEEDEDQSRSIEVVDSVGGDASEATDDDFECFGEGKEFVGKQENLVVDRELERAEDVIQEEVAVISVERKNEDIFSAEIVFENSKPVSSSSSQEILWIVPDIKIISETSEVDFVPEVLETEFISEIPETEIVPETSEMKLIPITPGDAEIQADLTTNEIDKIEQSVTRNSEGEKVLEKSRSFDLEESRSSEVVMNLCPENLSSTLSDNTEEVIHQDVEPTVISPQVIDDDFDLEKTVARVLEGLNKDFPKIGTSKNTETMSDSNKNDIASTDLHFTHEIDKISMNQQSQSISKIDEGLKHDSSSPQESIYDFPKKQPEAPKPPERRYQNIDFSRNDHKNVITTEEKSKSQKDLEKLSQDLSNQETQPIKQNNREVSQNIQKIPQEIFESPQNPQVDEPVLTSTRQLIENLNREIRRLREENEDKSKKEKELQQINSKLSGNDPETIKVDISSDKTKIPNDIDNSNRVTPTYLFKRKNSSDSSSSANSQCTIIRQIAPVNPLRDLCMESLKQSGFTLAADGDNKDMMKITIHRKLNSSSRNAPQIPIMDELELHYECDNDEASKVITILQVPPDMNRAASSNDKDRWMGLPSTQVPNLMVALSPRQKEFFDSRESTNASADVLLDMHKKFVERRAYHETSESSDNVENSANEDGYAADRETSVEKSIICDNEAPTTSPAWNDIRNCMVREDEFLKRPFSQQDAPDRTHLNESFEGKKFELENELKRLDNERQELEEELKNLQSLQHFKREEFLYNERKLKEKIQTEVVEERMKYGNDDFNEFVYSNEKLQQELYNEWQSKVLERHERKLQKTIKITPINDTVDDRNERPLSDVLKPVPLENEFMTKLKERKQRLSLTNETEVNSSTESLHHQNEESKKSDENLKTTNIPAHLYEFIKYYEEELAQNKNSDESGELKRVNPLLFGLIGVSVCLCGFFIGKYLTQR